MQVVVPSPSPARNALGPVATGFGSVELQASPSTRSQRRLRRSLRLSGASLASPGQVLNKENVGIIPSSQPSTSAKTLDVGRLDVGSTDNDKRSSPRLGSPLSGSSPLNSSPLRSRSSPLRDRSPLRRRLHSQGDEMGSSSDESDDSTLVFFGKPSSAEKKKRIHYEQRVLEKRLKHKDSLDLARRRPISFNPDDTMLIDDQSTYGWSWSRPTPTPSRSNKLLLSSPTLSSADTVSPTKSRGSTRSSSPDPLILPSEQGQNEEAPATPETGLADVLGPASPSKSTTQHDEPSSPPKSPRGAEQEGRQDETEHNSPQLNAVVSETSQVNPFVVAQSSPAKDSPARRSPSKQYNGSPRRNQSPVRSVETLIGVTMAHNRDLYSPMRSPRRSPRLSLKALQLSTSPTKIGTAGPIFGLSTPFQQPLDMQPPTPQQHSTPFQQPTAAPLVPPSTGLSRFACLQNLSALNNRAPETPANRALSMRLAHHSVLPSPFISTGLFELPATAPAAVSQLESPSRSPSRRMQAPSPAKRAATTDQSVYAFSLISRTSPSKTAPTPGTPSVRFAGPEMLETPSKLVQPTIAVLSAARSSSPNKTRVVADDLGSGDQANPASQRLVSPQHQNAEQATTMPATPPPSVAEPKPETPGPIFRQTARRVPIHQHEADFGVKVSPEKPSYSPRRGYANSSARNNEFGVKQDRIPARRVPMQPSTAVRQTSSSSKTGDVSAAGALRVASVASKAARMVSNGSNGIGGQSTSLSPAALARGGSSFQLASSTPSAATAQSAARSVSALQGSSVASMASRLQRPASAAFGVKPNSPSKQARSLSGLPQPRSAPSTSTSTLAAGPGSRLPRPATVGTSTNVARPTSRPVPMAIARLAPGQQSNNRAPAGSATARNQTVATLASTNSSPAEASPASEASTSSQDDGSQANESIRGSPKFVAVTADAEALAPSPQAAVQAKQPTVASSVSDLRRHPSASALHSASREASSKVQPESTAQTHQVETARMIGANLDGDSARSSSPVVSAPPARPPSSARSAPPVVLDPEQQRLRCLAMQEKARNRTPKGSSSASVTASSDMEELPSSDNGTAKGSPTNTAESAPTPSSGPSGAPSAVEALAAKHAEAVDSVPSSGASSANGTTASAATTTGRPLRSTRLASRPLAPSATRVPPSRGRALSLNDIIAARKIDVPLSLADQLKLADTVNKKHNEKTLARYKITKVQRPYERPPSPERHDHEPEACTIIDDLSSHRQGKGDLAPYSTPTKGSASAYATGDGRKSVRWYRPLFVGKGAQYGTRACESKPALKPIHYELDRMGNKVPTGCSPKLSKGQSIVIYRNYFKGEPEPADD
ncbi:uncharacterized protein SPSC_04428 [Sporisorium scitamineum]|uniref:Uncharacterized protein n=1 Tax=Sporisorium scitamineum TaxID=49012 RepID=A0A0F7S876_9BASI|nr:uncharacterized protein SPSC_04428 [Sporisorium scitamineum]CDW98441.1 hypothetical protein [Sporisorium scitamineum]